jgi:hypothetical protein
MTHPQDAPAKAATTTLQNSQSSGPPARASAAATNPGNNGTACRNRAAHRDGPPSEEKQTDVKPTRVSKLNGDQKTPLCNAPPTGQMLEREEWTAFRSLQGLCRKAGVPEDELARTVVKELVDNSLDAAGDCEISLTNGFVVIKDSGPGIPGDEAALASLFSLNRPQRSSKFLRLPNRGALGNGTRVAAGAVLATGGELLISTGRRTLRIVTDPQTGQSNAEGVGEYKGQGTTIQLRLGQPLELTPEDLLPSQIAIIAARAQEKRYTGKTSPHWYNVESFHELLLSTPDEMTVRDFAADLEGCFSSAGGIAAGFERRPARSLTGSEAAEILKRAKAASKAVNPERLGRTRSDAFPGFYKRDASFAVFPDGTEIPIVVEAWAAPYPAGSEAVFLVNGSVATVQAGALYQPKQKLTLLFAPGMRLELKSGKTGMLIHVNIITPHMPVTSDGKAPELGAYQAHLKSVIEKAVKAAKRTAVNQNDEIDVKACVFQHMDKEIVIVSDHRRYRFSWRQVFYRLRPIVKSATDKDLNWAYFSQSLTTEYEETHGEEPKSYRDPRGSFYVPHTGERYPLGTLSVENFRRPEFRFNKILIIEKEGFFEALIEDGFPERHDCVLMTSKGQPTRAARDLLDLIGETTEPVTAFLVHDCDAAGTIIFQSHQQATRARPERKIKIVNLGLDVAEATALLEAGVITEIETVEEHEKRLPVADYASDYEEWFQEHRVELNAFTTPDFIAWLDRKMAEQGIGKVIPPQAVMDRAFESKIRSIVREREVARALAEAGIDAKIETTVRRMRARIDAQLPTLRNDVANALRDEPKESWDSVIAALAKRTTEPSPDA